MPTIEPGFRTLVTTFNAAGALLVLQAMAEPSGSGRAGMLSPIETVLVLLWPFELWASSVVASRRLSTLGFVHAGLSRLALIVTRFACLGFRVGAGFDRES